MKAISSSFTVGFLIIPLAEAPTLLWTTTLSNLMSWLPAGASHTEINISLQPNWLSALRHSRSLTPNLCPGGTASETGPRRFLITCNLRDEAKGEQMEINGTIYQRSFSSYRRIGGKYLQKYEDLCLILATKVWGQAHIAPRKRHSPTRKDFEHHPASDRISVGVRQDPATGYCFTRWLS